MDLLLILVVFALGVGWGWRLRERAAERKMKHVMDAIQEAEAEEDEDRIAVTIEMVGDQLMVYDMFSGQFMAQGADWDAIQQRLKDRFPGKTFQATKENLDDMGITL